MGRRSSDRRRARPSPERPRRRRWLRGLGAVAAAGFMLGAAAVYVAFVRDLPVVDSLYVLERRPSITILSAEGTQIGRVGDYQADRLAVDEMPDHLVQAVLAIEDRRFYRHGGIDLRGIARAAWANLRAGRVVQGGSTITQQLAKLLFLTPERTFRRKIQEAFLARRIEGAFSKQEILAAYLNQVYLGAATYGVDAAARTYFGKPATGIDLHEAAILAGLLKAPSRLAPTGDPAAAARRGRTVLAAMAAAGFIGPAAMGPAHATGQAAAGATGALMNRKPAIVEHFPYFVGWVVRQSPHILGREITQDLIVHTTLDPALQRAARNALVHVLDEVDETLNVQQGAFVAFGPDGSLLAMIGGRDYRTSEFNRAARAKRQPGSAFKPFVYLAGLEAGLTPDTMMTDAPIRVADWVPKNFDGRYRGSITLRDALTHSVNSVSVRVIQQAGVPRVKRVASLLGVSSKLGADASLALGTSEVSLVELTRAYVPFATGGLQPSAYVIREVRNRSGDLVYRYDPPRPERLIPRRMAYDMTEMLHSVVESGTGKGASFGTPAAGKTGTSQDYRDAWFIGFTADATAGVWVGNDDDSPMNRVTGGSVPARIWRETMAAYASSRSARPLVADDRVPPYGRPESDDVLADFVHSIKRFFGD